MSEFDPEKILQMLQDQTRFSIFLHLLIYKKLTLKQLAEYLNKSKTTIFHHIRKLEQLKLIKSEAKDEGRKLLTKYFSLNYDTILNEIKLTEDESNTDLIKTKNLIIHNLMNYIIKFSEEHHELLDSTSIKIFPLSIGEFDEENDTFADFKVHLADLADVLNLDGLNNNEESPVTHIYAHVLIPIKKILEWKSESGSE